MDRILAPSRTVAAAPKTESRGWPGIRPWPWHVGGLALFLSVHQALAAPEGVVGLLVLPASYAVATCTGFAALNRMSRFPNMLRFPVALVLLIGIYAAGMLWAAFASLPDARILFLTGLGFQIVWLLAGARTRVLPGRARLLVVPEGRSLQACVGLQTHADLTLLRLAQAPHPADGIVLDPDLPLDAPWTRLLTGELRRLDVHHADAVIEALERRTPLEHLHTQLDSDFRISGRYDRVKRVIDVLLVLATAPLTVPACLLIALCIKLDSPGPILFRQTRVGRKGRHFEIVKFRSMRTRSDDRRAEFATADASRITRVGRMLRPIRIDEIPQFWNVLKGDMSLVGPRPEQVPFVETFQSEIPFYGQRHVVRPGVTGWAQINQGYVDSLDQTRRKLEYDLYYVKAYSPWLDLLILARTIPTILSGFGAR